MIKDLRLPLDRWMMMMMMIMITRFFYPSSDKEACGDRCNESRCIFPSLTFTDFPPEEIIVLNTGDDDDVNDEFLMVEACSASDGAARYGPSRDWRLPLARRARMR